MSVECLNTYDLLTIESLRDWAIADLLRSSKFAYRDNRFGVHKKHMASDRQGRRASGIGPQQTPEFW